MQALRATPPRQIGGFASLLDALDYAAAFDGHGLAWFGGSGQTEATLSYAQLHQRTQAYAAHLQTILGDVPSGARIGILAATGPWFLAAFCACQRLGLVPCPLPMPMPLQDMERYAQQLGALQQAAGMAAVLAPLALLGLLQPGLAIPVLQLEADEADRSAPLIESAPPSPNSIAYVQFSSGSTAQPKGIAISHRALMANVDAILRHGMRLTAADRAFSWLPYYHDMGLVGFVLAPLCAQVPVDYLAPSSFARRPALWPRLMAERASSVVYAPGFAWQLAARHQPSVPADARLDAIRIAGIGGDYVDAAALKAFATAYAAHGFSAESFKPSYGLAEATLAVTIHHAPYDSLEKQVQVLDNGEVRLHAHANEHTRSLVGCGPALPDWQLSILSADGADLPPLHEGEIVLKGTAQLSGVYQNGALQPMPAGAALHTGDRGFVDAHGCLYITGRIKELIVIHGRNLWPQDVEAAVHLATGAAREHMLLLQDSRAASTALVLLVHEKGLRKTLAADAAAPDAIPLALQRMAQIATQAAGSAVHACMVANGSIGTTSSGKMARHPTRLRLEAGQITILASTSSHYPVTDSEPQQQP